MPQQRPAKTTTKSHVSLEQHKCLVCAKDFDTGALLLDRRLRKSMEHHTLSGWGLCPDHQKLYDDGYTALVGTDLSKSDELPNGNISPSGAYRTGEIAHVRFGLYDRIFNVSGFDREGRRLSVVFCDPAVIHMLKEGKKENG